MNNGNYGQENGGYERSLDASTQGLALNLRVAMPGKVVSFDPEAQTVSVQPQIMQLLADGSSEAYPLLQDVPIYAQRGGKYVCTMPIAEGDPCLVIFGDRCADGWFSGGAPAAPQDYRMHDLSDGFALVGFAPLPQAIKGYSASSAAIRSLDGEQKVQLDPDGAVTQANAAGSTVLTPAGQFVINAPAGIIMNGNLLLNGNMGTAPGAGGAAGSVSIAQDLHTTGDVTAGSISLKGHRHPNPEGGDVGLPI